MAVSMKIAIFWVVAPCSLEEVYQRFRRTCCLHHQAASTSETSVNFYQTTHCYNTEDSYLHVYEKTDTTYLILSCNVMSMKKNMKYQLILFLNLTAILKTKYWRKI
jgi:hypothetical protein